MIGNETFAGFELLGIDVGPLKKLDTDFEAIKARIAKCEAELALLRPSEDNFDETSDKLTLKIKGYRSQLVTIAEDISKTIDELQSQVKLNPRQYIEADLEKIADFDKQVVGKLFQARDILRERGLITEDLQAKIDMLKGLGADISDPKNAWGDRWTGYELQWPAYTSRHALLFAGGRGVENAWAEFSDGEA